MNRNDYIKDLGVLALGSRLKRLSELCYQKSQAVYALAGQHFDPSSFPLLHYVHSHPDTSLIEIAQALGISHAAVSQRVTALSRENIIARRYPKKDKRTCLISLTKKGEHLVAMLAPAWAIIRETLEECLGEDTEALMHILGKCEAVMQGEFIERAHTKIKRQQSSQVTIIPFAKKYAPDFAALNEEWLEKYFEIEPLDKKVLGKPEKHIITKGGEIWFACRDKTILGCYALLRADDGTLEFTKFAVTPSARGQQIGRILIEHAIKRAQERGVQKLLLYTHSRLATACALYRKVGFVSVPLCSGSPYKRCDTFMQMEFAPQAAEAVA